MAELWQDVSAMRVVRLGGRYLAGREQRLWTGLAGIILVPFVLAATAPTTLALALGVGAIFLVPELARRLRNTRNGRLGERIVTDALRRLPDDYCLVNDVVLGARRGNVDHVLIGPCGVLAIETKRLAVSLRFMSVVLGWSVPQLDRNLDRFAGRSLHPTTRRPRASWLHASSFHRVPRSRRFWNRGVHPALASVPVPVPAFPAHPSPVRNRLTGPCIRAGEQTPGVRGQSPRLHGALVIPCLTTQHRDKVPARDRAATLAGHIRCHGDTWYVKGRRRNSISKQANAGATAVRYFLMERHPELRDSALRWVESIIVFTHPLCRLEVDRARATVVRFSELLQVVLALAERRRVSPAIAEQLARSLASAGGK